MKVVWLAVVCTMGFASPVPAYQSTQSKPSTPPAGQPETTDPLLLQPPQTPADVDARVQLARERLEALQPTTQPATAPTDEASIQLLEARNALHKQWETYLGQLQRIASLRESIAELSSEQRIQELTREIAELEEKAAELDRQPPPIGATEAEVAEITVRHKDADGRLTAPSELETRRSALLATGFKDQRKELEARVQELRQAREDFQAQIDATPATTPAEQEQSDLQRRHRDVEIAQVELSLAALAADVEQTALVYKQDEGRLEALRKHAAALQQRVTALAEARSRTALEIIELERERTTEPAGRALLDLRYFCESVLVHYFQSRTLLNALQDRFPQEALGRLEKRIHTSEGLWTDTLDSVAYRTGREVLQLRREARQERADFEAQLADLGRKRGESISQLHGLQTARDRTHQRLRDLTRHLLTAAESAESAEPAQRTRLETEATGLQSGLDEKMGITIAEAEEVVSRLGKAVELVEKHMFKLRDAGEQLYWTALRRRESGLAGLDWASVRADLNLLLGVQPETQTAAEAAESSLIASGILDAAPDAQAAAGRRLRAVGEDFSSVGPRGWLLAAALLVLGGGGAALLRRYARRRAEHARSRLTIAPRAADPPAEGQPRQFSQRLNLLCWQLAGDVLIPLALAVALWVAAWTVELPSRTLLPAAALLGLVLAVYLLLRFARRLFDFDTVGRHRIVPCGDAVAQHYRYWCRALLVFTLIVLPIPILLYSLDVAAGIRALLLEAWKTGTLVILLGFLLRKERVVRLSDPAQESWVFILVSALYPLSFVAILALLVLQVVGYGVLVEYVGLGALASLAVLVLTGGVVEYLCDLLDRYTPTARVGSEHKRGEPVGYVGRLLKSLLRVAGLAVAGFLIFRIWGGGVHPGWFTWRTIAFLALIVVAALVVDRILITALHALQTTGRLPEIASRIIRRWARGLLFAVAILLVITLAGASTDRLWAPLSAMFAMVAIGFVAVWSVLSNILATLIILIWQPFNVGERIEIQPDGIAGKVVDINFMYTLLKTDTGARTTVPNSLFIQKFIKREKIAAAPPRSLEEQLAADKPIEE